MSIKRILVNQIDTNLEYEVIGIDLAKNCVSAILLTTDGEIFGIDRLDYQELEKKCAGAQPHHIRNGALYRNELHGSEIGRLGTSVHRYQWKECKRLR